MGLGSEIRDPEKTYSGSRIKGSKRHRIPESNPHYCSALSRSIAHASTQLPRCCACAYSDMRVISHTTTYEPVPKPYAHVPFPLLQNIIFHKSRVSDPYSFFTDPDPDPVDPDPIRIQGFNDQKLKKNNSRKKNLIFF
jgi:hypothetical protein